MSYEQANHQPVIKEVVTPGVVKPRQKIELNATATDPDGNHIYYYWWHYPDPSGMDKPVKIVHETSSSAYFVVPETKGEKLHIILEVTDDGSPILKRYSRLVFTVEK
jgi:hypothetical protein